MKKYLYKIISFLPASFQLTLRRYNYKRCIKSNKFRSNEIEFSMLNRWLSAGDWAIDIGANIGHYTAQLAGIVGAKGRVLSFEPAPQAFGLLAANISEISLKNVSLFNVAVSDETKILGINTPKYDTGIENYYMANLANSDTELDGSPNCIFTWSSQE